MNYLRCHDDIGWGLDYGSLAYMGMEEIPHKRYLNYYFTGNVPGSVSRGELYNDDPVTKDARFCGTTASMCGIESAGFENDMQKLTHAVRFDIMLHAYMLMQAGIPMLYSGDEIGQVNDYSYKEDPMKRQDSRYNHRGKFHWELAAGRTDGSSVEGKIFQGLRQIEEIRKTEQVFGEDACIHTKDAGDISILCMVRERDGERMLGVFNFNDQKRTAWLNEPGDYVDMLSGEPVDMGDLELEGHSFVWAKKPK